MRLNIYKRSITDDSTDLRYELPFVVFGGTYNNLVVTGLHKNDYKFFDDDTKVHNASVYSDTGIYKYD